MRSLTMLLCFVLSLLVFSPVPAQEFELELAGVLFDEWYISGDPCVVGEYLYTPANGNIIKVLSLDDLSNPDEITRIESEEPVTGIALLGDRLIVKQWRQYSVYDITSPSDPQYLSIVDNLPFSGYYFQNQRLYLKHPHYPWFLIYDASDLEHPQVVDTLYTGGEITTFATSENYLFVHLLNEEVQIYSINEPGSPELVSSYPLSSNPDTLSAMAVSNNVLYVSNGDQFTLYDVTAHPEPVEIGSGSLEGYQLNTMKIEASDQTLYLFTNDRILHVIDFSDPANIQQVAEYDHGGYRGMLLLDDANLLLACDMHFSIQDFTDPESPAMVFADTIDVWLEDVAIEGNYAFVSSTNGLIVVDIHNPFSPEIVCTLETTARKLIEIENGLVVVINQNGPCSIIDASNPNDPILIREIDLDISIFWEAEHILQNNICYIPSTLHNTYAQSVDLTNPDSPVINTIGEIDSYNISVWDSFMATIGNGLSLYDISNLEYPEQLWSMNCDFGGTAIAVEPYDDYIFVISDLGFIRTYDLTDIEQPTQINELNPQVSHGVITHSELFDKYIFLPSVVGKMRIYDIEDPTQPDLVWEESQYFMRWRCDAERFNEKENVVAAVNGCKLYIYLFENDNEQTASEGIALAPQDYHIDSVYPNPFNSTCSIEFHVPSVANHALVVTNVLGREVLRFLGDHWQSGRNRVTLNAAALPSGSYYISLTGPGGVQDRKRVTLLK